MGWSCDFVWPAFSRSAEDIGGGDDAGGRRVTTPRPQRDAETPRAREGRRGARPPRRESKRRRGWTSSPVRAAQCGLSRKKGCAVRDPACRRRVIARSALSDSSASVVYHPVPREGASLVSPGPGSPRPSYRPRRCFVFWSFAPPSPPPAVSPSFRFAFLFAICRSFFFCRLFRFFSASAASFASVSARRRSNAAFAVASASSRPSPPTSARAAARLGTCGTPRARARGRPGGVLRAQRHGLRDVRQLRLEILHGVPRVPRGGWYTATCDVVAASYDTTFATLFPGPSGRREDIFQSRRRARGGWKERTATTFFCTTRNTPTRHAAPVSVGPRGRATRVIRRIVRLGALPLHRADGGARRVGDANVKRGSVFVPLVDHHLQERARVRLQELREETQEDGNV